MAVASFPLLQCDLPPGRFVIPALTCSVAPESSNIVVPMKQWAGSHEFRVRIKVRVWVQVWVRVRVRVKKGLELGSGLELSLRLGLGKGQG